jgi:hypothetical protein
MKHPIPDDIPAIAPIMKMAPPRKVESVKIGKNVADQNIKNTIFAAIVDTTIDIEMRAIFLM